MSRRRWLRGGVRRGKGSPVSPPDRATTLLRLVTASDEQHRTSDADLVRALVDGDDGAARAIWDRYSDRVHRFLTRALGPNQEIEDLTQEVFVRLCKDDFRLLRTYDPERASLSTWITIVARSTARDGLRRRRAETVPLDAVPEAPLEIEPVLPVDKLKLPEALLSPRQREILAMLYDREMDVAEIARALGIDPQTVRSAHHKAMVKLRAHFRAND